MGKLRLRQLRMRHSVSCTFEEFGTCHGPYDSSNHETSTLATGKDATGKAPEFTRELDLDQKTVPLHGRFGIYLLGVHGGSRTLKARPLEKGTTYLRKHHGYLDKRVRSSYP